MKICCYDAGHMTKMTTISIYGKTPSKFFFSGTGGPISTRYVALGNYAHHSILYCSIGEFCPS